MSKSPRRLGKYELREILGHGGMAEVWKAFDTHLQRFVAIKILHADLQNDPDFMKRFEREARVVASLHHRNIVQIHDFQISQPPESEGIVAYMVMEYIEGQTLTGYIHRTSRQGKFPPPADIIYLFACISNAIDYAHQRRMVHRDIKPSNILLDQGSSSRFQLGQPILTDFGIVKLLGSSTGTLSGGWLGTPVYIAPEQAQGHAGDERSDIYSLGVILYEICTGVRPFQGENPLSIIMQHINVMPTPPDLINPMIPAALAKVIMHALEKEPAARFASASEMTVALAQAFNLPIPVNLGQPSFSLSEMSELTYENRLQPAPPSIITPPASSIGEPSRLSYPAAPPTPELAVPASSELSTPTSPASNITDLPSIGNTTQSAPAGMPDTITPLSNVLLHPSTPRKKRRWKLIALMVLLLLLAGSGIFYWLSLTRPVSSIKMDLLVGHASFASSGQLIGENSSQGINDELQINLSSIPDPTSGKSYFAWLLSDKDANPTVSLLLGKLPVDHGIVDFLYSGDKQHTNLIGTMSRLLITEENANSMPSSPSPDQRTWRYYAELPQIPFDRDQHGKAIDTLRQLLYEDIPLEALGLHGGSDIHLYLNTKKVFEWADNARDSWQIKDTTTIHEEVVRILDYLDGASLVQADVPPKTPLLVDTTLASIPLIDLQKQQELKSYIDGMNNNLGGLLGENGITAKIRQLAMQADAALIGSVKDWLEQVHADAERLVKMTNAQLQLSSTLSILNDLAVQATYAYNGQIEPSTGNLQDGVVQIHNDIQQLITFDIKPYSQ